VGRLRNAAPARCSLHSYREVQRATARCSGPVAVQRGATGNCNRPATPDWVRRKVDPSPIPPMAVRALWERRKRYDGTPFPRTRQHSSNHCRNGDLQSVGPALAGFFDGKEAEAGRVVAVSSRASTASDAANETTIRLNPRGRRPFPRPQTGGSKAPHVWAAQFSDGPVGVEAMKNRLHAIFTEEGKNNVIVSMYKKGARYKDIATETGLSIPSVRYRLVELSHEGLVDFKPRYRSHTKRRR
jgi:hypothetical protein